MERLLAWLMLPRAGCVGVGNWEVRPRGRLVVVGARRAPTVGLLVYSMTPAGVCWPRRVAGCSLTARARAPWSAERACVRAVGDGERDEAWRGVWLAAAVSAWLGNLGRRVPRPTTSGALHVRRFMGLLFLTHRLMPSWA
jgi:hypothetical protein